MSILINWIINALAILATAYLLKDGVKVDSFTAALVVALILGIVNAILKPVLVLLTLPINLITFGLFTFVINALLILMVDSLVSGFAVNGFLWALLFSVVLSILNSILRHIFK